MIETIKKHEFDWFEMELIGYIVSEINKCTFIKLEFCPIYDSKVDITIKKKNKEPDWDDREPDWDDREFKSSRKPQKLNHSQTDPYGVYSHNDLRKTKTIIIFEGKINENFTPAKARLIRTKVLLHEIGHFIAYAIPFFKAKKVKIQNMNEYREDSNFQELWAQAFTYKILNDFVVNRRNQYSQKARKSAMTTQRLMNELAERQDDKYKTYQTLFNEDVRGFMGVANAFSAYSKISLNHFFYALDETRKSDSFYGEFSERFKYFLKEDTLKNWDEQQTQRRMTKN